MGGVGETVLRGFIDGSSSSERFEECVADLEAEFRPSFPGIDLKTVRAIAACRMGAPPELVARHVDWKGFESFCAGILVSRGYRVRTNILLRRPRAQVDILASGNSVALLVDCKHWERAGGVSALGKAVEAQKRRAERLRGTLDVIAPMAVVIVSLRDESTRFVDGAAIVPIQTLRDFVENITAYMEHLELQ